MSNQVNQQNISQESQQTQPSLQPEMPKKPNLPNWASILIITVVAIIVVGLVSYGAYRYFAPRSVEPPIAEPSTNGVELPINGLSIAEEESGEGGVGGGGGYTDVTCSEFSIQEENLPSMDTKNWQIIEDVYDVFSLKYPSNVFYAEIERMSLNETLRRDIAEQRINPDDFCLRSITGVSMKDYDELPEWWTEDRNKVECPYWYGLSVTVYSKLAEKGLSDFCQTENFSWTCCTTSPNYEIDGVPAIRCTEKCSENETEEQEGLIKCHSTKIRDSIYFVYKNRAFKIQITTEEQDKNKRAMLESVLSEFRFLPTGESGFTEDETEIKLYYGYTEDACKCDEPITRLVPKSESEEEEIKRSLIELFYGMTMDEVDKLKRHCSSGLPETHMRTETLIKELKIENGVAHVNFSEYIDPHGYIKLPSSCIGKASITSIRNTLLQFPTIEEVRIFIEGEEIDLSPFL